MLMVEPTCAVPTRDKDRSDPNASVPFTLIEDPTRRKDLTETELPN
jgi:hypothetical protein